MSELGQLYSQRNACYRQQAQYESDRAVVKEKIRRLKATKQSVERIKADAEGAKNYIASKMDAHRETWVGTKQHEVEDIHQNGINTGFQTYYNDVDYVLDAICDEITRLENENRNLGFLLNAVVNKLNDISNAIEKWLN